MSPVHLYLYYPTTKTWKKAVCDVDGKLSVDPEVTAALEADVGDASESTLGSLLAILGNPAQTFLAMIGYEGAKSLAEKLTAVRAAYLDHSIADLITRAKGLDDIHDDLVALVTAEPGYPVDSRHLLDHFNRKDNAAPDSDIWTVGGEAGYTVDMNVVDGEPTMIELVTPATTNEDAYINSDGTLGRVFSLNEDGITTVTFEARVKLLEDTYISVDLGLWKAAVTGFAINIPDAIYFRVASTDTALPWFARNANASGTATDTGVTQDTSWHTFKIVWTATSIKYYIDDVEEADHTVAANFPTAPLLVGAVVRAEENAAKHLRVDYMKVELS